MSAIKEIKMTESIGFVWESDIRVLKAENSGTIKINLSEKFCRNRTKLRLYLSRLDIYIYLNLLKFRTTEKCILFAAFYFKEEIYKWFEPYLSDYINYALDNCCQETDQMFASYYKFKTEISKVFEEVDKKRVVKRKLLLL